MYVCKYKSPTDLLGISIDELAQIDAQTIVRFEKKLKAKQLLDGQAFNNEEQFQLLEDLKNKSSLNAILYIESTPNLKTYLTTGEGIEHLSLNANEELLEKYNLTKEELRHFLTPYLDELFFPEIKFLISNHHFDYLVSALTHKNLLNDQDIYKISQQIEDLLFYLGDYIQNLNGHDLSKTKFIIKRSFGDFLSLFPSDYYIHGLVHYSKQLARKIHTVPTYTKEAEILVGAINVLLDIEFNNDNLHSGLIKIREHYFNRTQTETANADHTIKAVGFTVVIFIAVILVAISFKSNLNSVDDNIRVPYTDIEDNNFKHVYDKIFSSNIENNSAGFIKALQLKVLMHSKGNSFNIGGASEQSFSPIFEPFSIMNTLDSNLRKVAVFNAQRNQTLVVFRKNNESNVLVLPSFQQDEIQIKEGDSLIFYSGKNFIAKNSGNPKDPYGAVFNRMTQEEKNQVFIAHVVQKNESETKARIEYNNPTNIIFENIATRKEIINYLSGAPFRIENPFNYKYSQDALPSH